MKRLKDIRKKSSLVKPKTFYFKQSSVFLTYPGTDMSGLTKEFLFYKLNELFKPRVLAVCLEHHMNGAPHLHAWLEFEDEFTTRDCRIFDINSAHPNIGKMENKQKNSRANVLNYMLKEDKEIH